MTEQLNIVCGADIHQRFLMATILCRDGRTWTNRFLMNINGLLAFKDWLMSYGCQKVTVESTSVLDSDTYGSRGNGRRDSRKCL